MESLTWINGVNDCFPSESIVEGDGDEIEGEAHDVA